VSESESTTSAKFHDDLFYARQKLEALTKRYVEGLFASQEAAVGHAHLLSTILDSVGDALIVVDKHEKILLVNREAVRLGGWNMEEMDRSEFVRRYKFYKDEGKTLLPADEEPYAVALRERRCVQIEGFVTGEHLPVQGLWIRANAAPIIDDQGEILGVVTVLQDITERRRLQTQRDSLATLITHDLKNHLVSECAFLEMLKEDFADRLVGDDLKLLSELRDSNQRYLEIASTLLELYRTDLFVVESSRADVDIGKLLEAALALNQIEASKRGVSIQLVKTDSLPTIKGISSSLRQVLHNLLQNAIHASPAGGVVELSLTSNPTHVVVKVKDCGPGISAEHLSKLFEQSQVAAKFSVNPTSTGFGLYLCRLLVQAQGGSLTCESKPGEGALFILAMPIRAD
jgi:signal transduction histidine kinase